MSDDLIRDEDLGEPISELSKSTEMPAEGFLRRIRSSIDRRVLAGQIVDYSIVGLFKTFMEFLGFGVSVFARNDRARKERQ